MNLSLAELTVSANFKKDFFLTKNCDNFFENMLFLRALSDSAMKIGGIGGHLFSLGLILFLRGARGSPPKTIKIKIAGNNSALWPTSEVRSCKDSRKMEFYALILGYC